MSERDKKYRVQHKPHCLCFRCTGTPWNKGMKYTAEQKQTMSLEGLEKGRGLLKGTHIQTNTGKTHFKKGHTPWHIGKKGIMLNTGRTHFIKGQELSLDTRLKMSKSRRGEKNSNWRGG